MNDEIVVMTDKEIAGHLSMIPARVCAIFKRAFGLRDGIKELAFTVTKDEVLLTVTYFVPDSQLQSLENLEEFRLVPK